MAFKSYGNVWSNINRDIGSSFANDGRRASFSQNGFRDFGNFLVDPRKSRSPAGSGLSSGPFGSKMNYGSNSGPTSMPEFGYHTKNPKIYQFELGSSSSGSSGTSSRPGSGPNSLLTFGMEPKKHDWFSKPVTNKHSKTEVPSGGSSRYSSNQGSNNRLDWGGVVEGVFKEEVRKMSELFQRRSYY